MGIREFIQTEILLPRLDRSGVLVVYDPHKRYRELCQGLKSDALKVVDATETSIESREAAIRALTELGKPDTDLAGLLVYVPALTPVSDEERQRDPFALYGEYGSVFPEGDGDEYMSLCLKAKPDHATALRALFEKEPNSDFAVIDAVGGGLGWPTLRALLQAESSRDILFALLVPDCRQQEALKGQAAWAAEARDLFKAALSLKLKTRSKAWSTIGEELWRFLLFSEFIFDLPQTPPAALADAPHAPESARPLIEDLCDRLRNDQRTRVVYIDRAEAIEKELELPSLCAGITDLGKRDTFPFEERTFFAGAVAVLKKENFDRVREVIRRHAGSVWVGKGESQAQWGLIQAALDLTEACDDFERQLPDHSRSQETLIDLYLGGLREADRHQREFEQAVGDHLAVDGAMGEVIDQARGRYRRLAEKIQLIFTKQLEASGWPPAGRLANAEVFDRLVVPSLQQSGRRVAYLLIDALRYELGAALRQQLAEDDPVELQAAYAQLPTITVVGMASLLPGAGEALSLVEKDDGLVPMLGDAVVANVNQRMEVLRKQYGDRFAEMKLNDFVRARKPIPASIHLLMLRSVDIDSQLENSPETTLSLIHDTLKRIRAAIHKLKKGGFHEVGGIKIKDSDTIQIMKDFMANGRFSRGVEVIADASLAFVGNIDQSVRQIVHSTEYDLFQPLPPQFDLAVMDRFACYLPGWEMPKNSTEYLTNNYGLITDFLAEAFHYQLKHTNRYEEVSKRIKLGRSVEGRDEKGIKKTVSAFLKILHPAEPPSDEEFEEYVAYAIECRRRIKEQMNKRKPDDEFAPASIFPTSRQTGGKRSFSVRSRGTPAQPSSPCAGGSIKEKRASRRG